MWLVLGVLQVAERDSDLFYDWGQHPTGDSPHLEGV